MKKYNAIITMAAVLAAGSASAQNLVDAVRFGSSDLGGTARYRSMAGAFGALGGDPSCMGDNPAGLAIYRGTNVMTITPNMSFTSTETQGNKKGTNDDNNFSIANMSGVFSFKTPDSDNLVNFNLGIGFERRQENFRKYNVAVTPAPGSSFGDYLTEQANSYLHKHSYLATALGADDAWSSNAPLLSLLAYDAYAIDTDPEDKFSVYNPVEGLAAEQAYRVREKNRHDEYNISGSFNFNDVFYVGANMKITDFNSTIQTEFDEFYPSSPNDALYYDNTLETKGSGIGLNLGVLWKATDSWRIGAAIHTPTWMNMKEIYSACIQTDCELYNEETHQYEPSSPWSEYSDSWEYDFMTPWEYQLSTAYILGTQALISLEWDMKDFTTMKYSENDNYYMERGAFDEINDAISNRAQLQHTFKAGLEYRIDKNLSARLGYAYTTSPFKKEAMLSDVNSYDQYLLYSSSNKVNYSTLDSQQYLTAGMGWRGKSWTFDFACVYQSAKEYVAAYPADYANSNIIDMDMSRINWDLTIGYRF